MPGKGSAMAKDPVGLRLFSLSWKETSGRFGTVKSETTPVQVSEDMGYTKALRSGWILNMA